MPLLAMNGTGPSNPPHDGLKRRPSQGTATLTLS